MCDCKEKLEVNIVEHCSDAIFDWCIRSRVEKHIGDLSSLET